MTATMRTLAWVLCVTALPASAYGTVEVSLRERAVVTSRLVRVGDIADLFGGTPALREKIARLDITEASEKSAQSISQAQVEFRLRLGEISESQARLTGPGRVQVVARFRTVSAEEITRETRKSLASTLPWSADEVQIDLVQPIVASLPQVADDETVVIKSELQPGQRPPGRVQMNVQIVVNDEQKLSLPVYFEVRPCVRVVVCRNRVSPGEPLSDTNVFEEKRPIDGRAPMALDARSFAGKKVTRPLLPGHVVQVSDVEAPAPKPTAPIIVKAQEAVRLQVNVGSLKVVAAGQALQDGAAGQLIRVQNIDSQKVLVGRVIERGLIAIE